MRTDIFLQNKEKKIRLILVFSIKVAEERTNLIWVHFSKSIILPKIRIKLLFIMGNVYKGLQNDNNLAS